MKPEQLTHQIRQKQSCLCVGLDTDLARIPRHLLSEADPVFAFNREIIAATQAYAVAYKPNLAFYEALGPAGWESLQKTLEIIPPEIMVIADAKRGDIGNTSRLYAQAFFETMEVDAITVAPYMGRDSVQPFLEFDDKWVFLLALTSNPGANDFQYGRDGEDLLYQKVLQTAPSWAEGKGGHLGFVVGATRAEAMQEVRRLAPKAWLLVPGIGAQGGDLNTVLKHGLTSEGGLLINSSRGIIYAGQDRDFAQAAAAAARDLQQQMALHLQS